MAYFFAGLTGALIGLAVILADASTWFDDVYASHPGKPDFYLWVFLIAAQLALSFVLAIPTVRIVRPLYRHSRHTKTVMIYGLSVALIVVVFVLSTVLFLAPNFRADIPAFTSRILALNLVSFAVVLIGAIGGWLIYFALGDEFKDRPTKTSIDRFVNLRLELNTLLWVVGLILGASLISMAGLRNAVIAYTSDGSTFPGQYLFIYGAFFSSLLALAYLPIHTRALSVGRSLRDRLVPMPTGGDWTSMPAWNTSRKALEEALRFDLSANASARTALAILTPLAGSLIGLILGR